MPHHKSAKKRVRQTIVKTAANRTKSTIARTYLKAIRTAIAGGNKEDALKNLPIVQKYLGRLVKSGIIKPNKAARTNSRLAKQTASL